ncbi:MAG: NADPH:quinone oxidoreductase family protein [Minwuia sp.]|nr:NADPH:quinone oxidoreductase family protein [Minwuia sp.]
MRAVVCREWMPFDELELGELPVPEMRAGAVRIRIDACGISFATGLVVQGKYQRKPPRPFAPGTEVVGTVIECADDVSRCKVSDLVMAFIDWGGSATEAVVWEGQAYQVPEGLSAVDAIPLLSSYGTSYGALVERAELKAGQTVLVHGAGGGVGLSAVEIAKDIGATVIARAGTEEKRDWVRQRGADHVLDSRDPDFRDTVLDLTDGRGVDVVYDPLGGDVFHQSLRCMDMGGRLLTIGYASGDIPQLGINLLLLKNITVMGFNWGTYWGWTPADERVRLTPERDRVMAGLNDLWARGAIQPKIHATYPLAQFRELWADIKERRAVGRVVLLPQE